MEAAIRTSSSALSASRRMLGLFLLALLCVARQSAAADAPVVQAIRVPDGGFYPQAAVDMRGRIHLVYFKGDALNGDVFYARSDDSGRTFTKQLRVNSGEGSVIVAGTVRGPHMSLGRGDRVHVAWMGSSKSAPKAGRRAPLLYTRMNDAGDAFEPQRDVSSEHPGLDGGGSVSADADGNVYVAWHAPADHTKEEGELGRYVWVARSQDDGKTFSPDVAANPKPTGVCACCGMRIFTAGKGRVLVVYRAAEQLVNRDIQLLASEDHGKTFKVASHDPWKIAKCVMSTAAFASAPKGQVLTAWETKGHIRIARIDQKDAIAGEAADAPGEGNNRKHPAIAANRDGMSILAWTEGTSWGKSGSIAWQSYDAEGRPQGPIATAKGLPVWGVPAVVALPDGSFRVIY